MSTRKRISVVLAVALAALVWLAWPSSPRVDPSAIEASATPADGAVPDPSLGPAAASEPEQRTALPATPPEAPPDQAAAPSPKPPPPGPRWVVRGRVGGVPAGRAAETRLGAACIGRFYIPSHAECAPADDGTYELELTPVVKEWLRNAPPTTIVMTAEGPVSMRETAQIAFTSGVVDESDPVNPCTVFRCDLALRSGAVVTGRVEVAAEVAEDAAADRASSDRRRALRPIVGLLEEKPGASGGGVFVDQTSCDGEGRWTLRADHAGPFRVVAAGEGLRPASTAVELVVGQSTVVAPLLLSRGAEISGVVRRMGAPIGGGARVAARPAAKGPVWNSAPVAMAGQLSVRALEVGYEHEQVVATTLEDGSFRLGGLAEIEYELSILSAPLVRASFGSRARIERVVRAPAAGVDLEGVQPTIVLSVTVKGSPPLRSDLEDVHVEVVPLAPSRGRMDLSLTGSEQGFGSIQVEADVAHELRVRPGRYAALTESVPPLELGEERSIVLDLWPQEDASSLVLRIVTGEPEHVAGAEFLWSAAEAADRDQGVLMRLERSEDGAFHFERRTSGRYRVEIRPFDQDSGGACAHYLATRFDVLLPPKQVVQHEIALERGARIRMSAKDERGTFVRAKVVLRGRNGAEIPTGFYCATPDVMFGCGWYLCEQGINDHPALPAGQYTFTLSGEAFRDEAVSVELVAGETRTLEITMHPR